MTPRIVSLIPVMVLFNMLACLGQDTFKAEIPTGKVERKVNDYTSNQIPKKKEIEYIYVEDAKKMMIGNPCAIEYTRAMGFEYELWHRPDTRFSSFWSRFWHNTWIKSKLCVTRGPWWRAKVKKRFKACAIQSGDFTG